MRWSIVRLIAFRELRDLLRDRRTLFLVLVLPIFLYPGLGLVGLVLSLGMVERPSIVGVLADTAWFPPPAPSGIGGSPVPVASWFALLPGQSSGIDRLAGTAALVQVSSQHWDFPPLVREGHFLEADLDPLFAAGGLQVQRVDGDGSAALDKRHVDQLLTVPADFWEQVAQGGRPVVKKSGREGDDRSRLAGRRLRGVLQQWQKQLQEVRLRRRGLPAQFAEPIAIHDADQAKPLLQRATDEMSYLLVRVLPFLVVMWALAGALYPAVDLAAGEKERGTLETILVSPASRSEIVWGKFFAVWTSSTATTLWNLLGLVASFACLRLLLPMEIIRPMALLWSAFFVLPLSALFSAICLAVGVYARSTKEGQYYLMPLVLGTTLLVFVALAPGVELTPFYSVVPVTGAALFQQRLMTAHSLDQVPWLYAVPVFASLGVSIWLALRWAVSWFQREEVLFR